MSTRELNSLYDEVLRAARDLVDTRRLVGARMRSLPFLIKHAGALREIRTLTTSPLFLRTAAQQALLEDALSDCDQSLLVVKATLEPAPLMVVAEYLSEKHKPSAADLAQLKALHRTRVRVTSASAPRPVLAGVVGFGAIAGSLVPEEAFHYLGWDWYEFYRTAVAAVTVVVLLYAALSLAPAYMAYRQRSLLDTVAAELIEHIVATCGPADAPT